MRWNRVDLATPFPVNSDNEQTNEEVQAESEPPERQPSRRGRRRRRQQQHEIAEIIRNFFAE